MNEKKSFIINSFSCSDNCFEDIKLLGNGEFIYKDIMIAKMNGNYGMFDCDGKSLNSFQAQDMDVNFGEWIAFKDESGKWGFVNNEGEIVIEPKYEDAKSFSNGLAAVCIDDKWGYINEEGNLVIANDFLDVGYFTDEGLSFVSKVEGEYYIIKLRFKGRN